jgi:hypothetical protein
VNKLPPDHKKKNFNEEEEEEEEDSDFRDNNNAKMSTHAPHTSASVELGVEANIFCREWHSNGSIASSGKTIYLDHFCPRHKITKTTIIIIVKKSQ